MTTTVSTKTRSTKNDSCIGPTDPKIDNLARDKLIKARIQLMIEKPFFGNLATRLPLTNADEWCPTAGTDGVKFYYNSRFVMKLRPGEVMFLVGHEILHACYDHINRRENRESQLWNIADDYAVNSDLRKHKIGEFITTVPCLYDAKYDGMSAEQIYDLLLESSKKMTQQQLDDLIDQLIDEHMNGSSEDGDEDSDGDESKKRKNKRPKMSDEQRQQAREDFKNAILSAAQTVKPGELPGNLNRIIEQSLAPKMPWRELIQTSLTSAIKSDYSWMRPSRRSWHIDAIMPGSLPDQEIDVVVAIDTSGSISTEQIQQFLGEVSGMMDLFTSYKIRVFSFDTGVYNSEVFTPDNASDITQYQPYGGGGTSFECIYRYLKNEELVPNRLIVFTDGYGGGWGDSNYCDTTWVIHGSNNIVPEHGTYAYFDDYK